MDQETSVGKHLCLKQGSQQKNGVHKMKFHNMDKLLRM